MAKKSKQKQMTTNQFRAALKRLGLTKSSQRTGALLGMGLRQCQRMANGETPVSRPVSLLLALYLKHGLESE